MINNNSNYKNIIEEETFIDIEEIIEKDNKKNVYQFQLNKEECIIKLIGECCEIPEIIIKENFGIDNKFSIYSYIYNLEEIIHLNLNNYVPIIRLINNKTKEVYSICIKYQLEDNFSKELICKNFDLYFIIIIKKDNDTDNEMIKMNKKIDKNIDPNNIIEILFENTIDSGIIIFNSYKT
jgi:hypothetical protein